MCNTQRSVDTTDQMSWRCILIIFGIEPLPISTASCTHQLLSFRNLQGYLSQYINWDRGWTTRVRFPATVKNVFLLPATEPRQALGPTQTLIQWALGVLSLDIKRKVREADHLHLVSMLRIRGPMPPLSHMSSWRGN